MPATDDPKRQEPVVELATKVPVRDDFAHTIQMPGNAGSWRVHMRVGDDHELRLVSFETRWTEQPKVTDVTDERMRRVIELAVIKEAEHIATHRMINEAGGSWGVTQSFRDLFGEQGPLAVGGVLLDEGELDDVAERARAGVRPKPGRRPVSDEAKLQVLDLYREKTVPEIMEITGKKERTIRRWIADAKRLEGDR